MLVPMDASTLTLSAVCYVQGRADSFAFLEVFFDDKSGLAGGGTPAGGPRGVKRDYDDAIGLSLDGDDGASQCGPGHKPPPAAATEPAPARVTSAGAAAPSPAPAPLPGEDADDAVSEGSKLKRAYDDALAARGLIAVRRSCEKLTDLALPAGMQRTLSQEYIRQQSRGQPLGDFFSAHNSAYAPHGRRNAVAAGGAGTSQQPLMPQIASSSSVASAAATNTVPGASHSVEVPSSTKCSLCSSVNVDTQLRPCGHMFHGRCLKPSLQNATGPPKCPICTTPMQSAILAVPSPNAGADGAGAALGTTALDGLVNGVRGGGGT